MEQRSLICHRIGRGSLAAIVGVVGSVGAGGAVLSGLSGGTPVAAAASATSIPDNVFVADPLAQGSVFEVASGNATAQTVASGFEDPKGIALNAAGDLFVSDQEAGAVYEQQPASPGTGVVRTEFATGLSAPQGLAANAKGDVEPQ